MLCEESRARCAPRPPTPAGPAAGPGKDGGASSHLTLAAPFCEGGRSRCAATVAHKAPLVTGAVCVFCFLASRLRFLRAFDSGCLPVDRGFSWPTVLAWTPEGPAQRPCGGRRPGDGLPPLGPADPIPPPRGALWGLALGCARPFLEPSALSSPPR